MAEGRTWGELRKYIIENKLPIMGTHRIVGGGWFKPLPRVVVEEPCNHYGGEAVQDEIRYDGPGSYSASATLWCTACGARWAGFLLDIDKEMNMRVPNKTRIDAVQKKIDALQEQLDKLRTEGSVQERYLAHEPDVGSVITFDKKFKRPGRDGTDTYSYVAIHAPTGNWHLSTREEYPMTWERLVRFVVEGNVLAETLRMASAWWNPWGV